MFYILYKLLYKVINKYLSYYNNKSGTIKHFFYRSSWFNGDNFAAARVQTRV
jgi:hypothetical protein